MNIKKAWWFMGGGQNAYWTALKAQAELEMITLPSLAQQVKLNTLLSSIDSVLPLLDWLYITLNNTTSDFYRLNVVAPSTFKLTGTPTKTSNQGVKSDGTTYLDTGWDYGNRINYSQNNGCAFAWVFTDGNDAKATMGAILSGTDRTISLATRDASNRVAQYGINSASANAGANGTMTADTGLHIVNRVDSGNQTHYRNNIQTATSASASITPSNIDVSLLARNFNGVRDSHFLRDISIFGCGSGLNADQRNTLYNGLLNYVNSPE